LEAADRKHCVASEPAFSTNPGFGESASVQNYPSGLGPVLNPNMMELTRLLYETKEQCFPNTKYLMWDSSDGQN